MPKLLTRYCEEEIEYFEGPGERELYRRIEITSGQRSRSRFLPDNKVTWETLNPVYNNWQGAFRQTSELELETEYQEKYAS